MAFTKDYVPPHEHKDYLSRQECQSFMTAAQCEKRMDKIDIALWGEDGLNGMVVMLSDIKKDIATIVKEKSEEKKKGRDWRLLGFTIGASLTTGTIIEVVNFILTHIH